MKLLLELTPKQLDELADQVADRLLQKKVSSKEAYTVKEAAQRLGVHTVTIRRGIAAQTIPTIPGLGAIRIPASYVDAAQTKK